MENLQKDHLTHMDLEIDTQVRQQLNDAGKWTRFISIVMFVASGLILLFGIIGGAALNNVFRSLGSGYSALGDFDGGVFIAIVAFVAIVLAVVYYFMFDFSNRMKTALLSESLTEFNKGLKSLKTFFIITTIFAIISLLSSVYNLFN